MISTPGRIRERGPSAAIPRINLKPLHPTEHLYNLQVPIAGGERERRAAVPVAVVDIHEARGREDEDVVCLAGRPQSPCLRRPTVFVFDFGACAVVLEEVVVEGVEVSLVGPGDGIAAVDVKTGGVAAFTAD